MRVLFVDDEADARDIIGDALRVYGFEVEIAADGAAAIRALEAEAFDAIVTDFRMPNGVDGIQVAEEARRKFPGVGVLIVSGYARAQLPALPAGVRYMAKPYRLAQLISALRALVQRR